MVNRRIIVLFAILLIGAVSGWSQQRGYETKPSNAALISAGVPRSQSAETNLGRSGRIICPHIWPSAPYIRMPIGCSPSGYDVWPAESTFSHDVNVHVPTNFWVVGSPIDALDFYDARDRPVYFTTKRIP